MGSLPEPNRGIGAVKGALGTEAGALNELSACGLCEESRRDGWEVPGAITPPQGTSPARRDFGRKNASQKAPSAQW